MHSEKGKRKLIATVSGLDMCMLKTALEKYLTPFLLVILFLTVVNISD